MRSLGTLRVPPAGSRPTARRSACRRCEVRQQAGPAWPRAYGAFASLEHLSSVGVRTAGRRDSSSARAPAESEAWRGAVRRHVRRASVPPLMEGSSSGLRSSSVLYILVTVASASRSIFVRSSDSDISESSVPTRSCAPGTLKAERVPSSPTAAFRSLCDAVPFTAIAQS